MIPVWLFCAVLVMSLLLFYQLVIWMLKDREAPDTYEPENKLRG